MDHSTRHRFNVVKTAALAVMSAALMVACDGGTPSSASECRTFRTTLSVKDRMSQGAGVFNPGEPITFELQIANTSIIPATLTAASSCTPVVFEVFDASEQHQWGGADWVECVVAAQPRTYSPLEVVTESRTWNQKGSGPTGAQVPSGNYRVTASVGQYLSASQGRVDCRAELGQTTTFRIL